MELLDRPLDELMAEARTLRDEGARPARHLQPEGLHPADEALPRRLPLLHVRAAAAARRARVHDDRRGARGRARRRARAGCREALFTLGDKPELRYRAARDELAALGFETTLEYLARAARRGARGDVAAAAPQPRRADARRLRAAAAGGGVDGADARDDLATRLSAARRAALRLAGQAAGGAARDAAARRARRACRSRPGS